MIHPSQIRIPRVAIKCLWFFEMVFLLHFTHEEICYKL
jgi:hypothetical protein